MRGWWAVLGAVLCAPATPWAAPCDQFDPAGPAASAQITLDGRDLVDERGDELRAFVATGSLGRVDVAVIAALPRGIVQRVSAIAETSRFSPNYGEELKGIAVAVALSGRARPAKIVLRLRQVCAVYFRSTFLNY